MDTSHWQIRNRFIALLGIAFGVPLVMALLLPALSSTGKPVGNIGARMTCGRFLRLAKTAAATNDHRFDLSKVQADLAQGFFWRPRNAQFLIKTNFQVTKTSQEIVIACTNSYRNVPGPGLWASLVRKPLHAVGSADGKVKLISGSEFTALDLSGFTPLDGRQTRALPQP